MSRYSEWLSKQDSKYIQEISNGEITAIFIDRNIRAISLRELEQLDNLYICDVLNEEIE